MARMRTETGVSSGTTASSDWEENTENKNRIEEAKTIVKTAITSAVKTVQQVGDVMLLFLLNYS